jgi:hypothetical protein
MSTHRVAGDGLGGHWHRKPPAFMDMHGLLALFFPAIKNRAMKISQWVAAIAVDGRGSRGPLPTTSWRAKSPVYTAGFC